LLLITSARTASLLPPSYCRSCDPLSIKREPSSRCATRSTLRVFACIVTEENMAEAIKSRRKQTVHFGSIYNVIQQITIRYCFQNILSITMRSTSHSSRPSRVDQKRRTSHSPCWNQAEEYPNNVFPDSGAPTDTAAAFVGYRH
jgi:hypothetical protein